MNAHLNNLKVIAVRLVALVAVVFAVGAALQATTPAAEAGSCRSWAQGWFVGYACLQTSQTYAISGGYAYTETWYVHNTTTGAQRYMVKAWTARPGENFQLYGCTYYHLNMQLAGPAFSSSCYF